MRQIFHIGILVRPEGTRQYLFVNRGSSCWVSGWVEAHYRVDVARECPARFTMSSRTRSFSSVELGALGVGQLGVRARDCFRP